MTGTHIVRHKFVARLTHWLMAACVLTLLATGLLPIVGVKFDWTVIHWIAGLTLTVLVLLHIIRVLFSQHLLSMGLGWRDLRALFAGIGIGRSSAPRPGKYTLPQKLMHHAIMLAGLTAIGTGLVMLRKLDTPFWKRDPYFLSEQNWGLIYVFHDLASLSFVTLVLLHIYFTLQPNKFFYLRSMITGRITQSEFAANHDARRWKAPGADEIDEAADEDAQS